MRKQLTTLAMAAALSAAAQTAQPEAFTSGIFLLNEDWFGHSSGSICHISTDNHFTPNVFKAANPGHCLGNTSTYGEIYGNRLLVMSKQNYTGEDGRSGGRLMMADATTLKFINGLETLPCGDGRAVCSVSDDKAYITGSTGIAKLDINSFTATALEGIDEGIDNKKNRQCGDILRYGSRVFAAQQNVGVLAIDIETDAVTTISLPSVAGLIVTADGSLYAATTDAQQEFVRIDPTTLATSPIDIEGSNCITSSWGSWRPSYMAADNTGNIVYYASGGSWSVKTVKSYNFDTGELNATFFTAPSTADGVQYNQELYGQGLSIDPLTGELRVVCTESGFGTHYEKNWIYTVDKSTGAIIADKTLALPDYYWFPSMLIYAGLPAPSLSVEAQSVSEEGLLTLNLSEWMTLAAGNRHLVNYSLEAPAESHCRITDKGNGLFEIEGISAGETALTAVAEYQGRRAEAPFMLTVTGKGTSTGCGQTTVSALHDVWTLSGIKIMEGADASQLRNLPAGIYIIDGRKVAVR